MRGDGFKIIVEFLTDCVTGKIFPGAVCWIGDCRNTYFYEAYGNRRLMPDRQPMKKDTIFDLASLTKPLATALSIMKLCETKDIRLDDKVDKFFTDSKGRAGGSKTIRQLLTHTAGLPAWFPLYSIRPEKRLEYLADAGPGGKKVVYSCLGYIILGKIVEKITRSPLDVFFRDLTKGLPLKHTSFPTSKILINVAATEKGDRYERTKYEISGKEPTVKWRNYLIQGEVHDGNCFYGYRGVAGNAGLFSNVPDLVIMTRAYVDGRIVKPTTVRLMTTDHTGGKNPRGLGWMMNMYPDRFSPAAYGHTGFTGTMLCHDPAIDLTVILLTNDIHPRVKPGNMPPVRKRLMKIIAKIFNG
jgi:CubicO group peptidase (beta-lactamase class C family)